MTKIMNNNEIPEEINEQLNETLGIDEQDLYVPIRMAVLIGESVWSNTKYSE